VIWTKVPTITALGNLVAVVAAALLPVAMLRVPVVCAMLLPHDYPLTILPPVYVDADCDPVPRIPAVVQVIATTVIVDIHIVVRIPIV
jgi:hypothetical protein